MFIPSPLALPSFPLPAPSTVRAPDCVCVCIFAVPRLAPHHHVSLCSSCLASHCLSPLSQCSSLSFHLPLHSALRLQKPCAAPLPLPRNSPVVRSALVKEPSSFSSSSLSSFLFYPLVLRLFDPARNRATVLFDLLP